MKAPGNGKATNKALAVDSAAQRAPARYSGAKTSTPCRFTPRRVPLLRDETEYILPIQLVGYVRTAV